MTVVDAQAKVAYWASVYGVPPEIALAVANRESGFQQSARGAKGEVGVMQLMPPTAAALGVDAYDPEQNIRGGVQLLRDEYARFGDWPYALAAYNCGAGCAAKGPDHWPPATRNYVAAIVGMPAPTGPATGVTGEWDGMPAPTEFDLLGGADPVMLLVVAAAVAALYFYFAD